ncbi:MAG: DNA primase [Thermoleophilaceae bacterium]|nr:DNA primase [Thermoleophilaceae bacterium]
MPKPSSRKLRRYSDTDLAALKQAADIGVIAARYTELTPSGANLTGCCPIHEEDSPSFTVTPARGLFHCFGCHAAGDVIALVRQVEDLDFPRAVDRVAELSGFSISSEPDEDATARKNLLAVLERAASFYQRALNEAGPEARKQLSAYFEDHAISAACVADFHLGLAAPGAAADELTQAALSNGVPLNDLIDAGLTRIGAGEKPIDYFRNRLIFPIYGLNGQITGFGGRALGDFKPKYLNSPQSPAFNKSSALYGNLPERQFPRPAEPLIVVEGYTDALAINSNTDALALSPMGTSLTKQQAALIAGNTSTVYLIFDADPSGADSAIRASERLLAHKGLDIRLHQLPEGSDPASLIAERGPGVIREAINHYEPPFVFAVRNHINRADLTTARGRDALIDELAPLFASTPAGPLRHEQLELAAVAAQIPTDELRSALLERAPKNP